jgi:hypothetical protein
MLLHVVSVEMILVQKSASSLLVRGYTQRRVVVVKGTLYSIAVEDGHEEVRAHRLFNAWKSSVIGLTVATAFTSCGGWIGNRHW